MLPTGLGWDTGRSLPVLLGTVAVAETTMACSPREAAAEGCCDTWEATVAVKVSSRCGSGGALGGTAAGTLGCGIERGRPGSSSAVALESQITLRRKNRCSVGVVVAAAPRLSLSIVCRRRRYSSVLPIPESAAVAPSFSPTEELEFEPFLGTGAGGERKPGVPLCFSAAPSDMAGPVE